MIRTLAIAAGLAVGVTSAQAAFTGILVEEADSAAASAALGGAAVTVLRVYAMYDGLGQQTALPGGDANLTLNTFGTNIDLKQGTYQVSFVPLFPGDPNPSPNILPITGFAGTPFAWGSYGTIGTDAANADLAIDPGTDVANALGQGNAATNFGNGGGWRNGNPPNNLGLARSGAQPTSGGFGTLLFQLSILGVQGNGTLSAFSGVSGAIFLDANGNKVTDTVADGLGFLNGSFNVASRDVQTPITHRVVFGSGVIPTPGSLALFGLAGLAAVRRRR